MKKFFGLLLSLVMMLSVVIGVVGCNGDKTDADIKAAYNLYVAYAEEKGDTAMTYQEWLATIKGEKGDPGTPGPKGDPGTPGEKGANGKDGKSAYEIYVASVAEGETAMTEAEWLESLKGAKGANGENGADGRGIKSIKYMEKLGVAWLQCAMTDGTTENVVMSVDEEALLAAMDDTSVTSYGKANFMGTTNCYNSVQLRFLANDHDYFTGAAAIAQYLKGVFVENDGVVSVSASSTLRKISYTDQQTLLNFGLAYSGYQQNCVRRNIAEDADITAQVALAKKFFTQVDYNADSFHKTSGGGGMSFLSYSAGVTGMASMLGWSLDDSDENAIEVDGQKITLRQRYLDMLQVSFDRIDAGFWGSGMYINPFYQLCVHEGITKTVTTGEGDDAVSTKQAISYKDFGIADLDTVTALTDASVLNYYGYGVDLANDYADLWNAYLIKVVSDGKISQAELKALTYHFAYQATDGKIQLGNYSGGAAVVGAE